MEAVAGFSILLLITSGVACYIGYKHGFEKSCDNCFRNGAQVGFQAGIVASQKLKIDIEPLPK